MIKTKKKLQRLYSESHDQETKTKINNLNNRIKKYTKKAKEGKWNELCSFLATKNPSETVFWKTINQIESGNKPDNFDPLPSTIKQQDKANKFAEFYESVFANKQSKDNSTALFRYKDNSDPKFSAPITLNEVKFALLNTKGTTSTGLDGISNKLLKLLPECVLALLAKIYDGCFGLSHIPKHWKIAKIKVLKKKSNNLDDPSSYRPISLINTLSRLFEKIINIRLLDWAESTQSLHKNQSGFRKHRSTQDNIFKIIETCKNALQTGKKCGMVLFDIEKAFDKAPHKGILRALSKLNCPPKIGFLLSSFLSNRKFVVEINGSMSETKNIRAGVPQGSPLSPLLFSLFINNIGNLLDKHKINFALFADDLTIWCCEKDIKVMDKILQSATIEVANFFRDIGLAINISKCEYTLFEKSCSDDKLSLLINNSRIEYAQNPKVLGIFFDPNLNFKYHFEEIKKQLASKHNLIRILSYKSNAIAENKLVTIYKSLILSKIQYSMLPFLVTSNKIKNDLQIIQNKCLKTIMRLPLTTSTELIHTTLKISPIEKRLSLLACNYINKAKGANQTIDQIIQCHKSKNHTFTKKHSSILDRLSLD